jgi:hypothetical protein
MEAVVVLVDAIHHLVEHGVVFEELRLCTATRLGHMNAVGLPVLERTRHAR